MDLERREFLAMAGVAVAGRMLTTRPREGAAEMFGLIGRMNAAPGQRDALIAILRDATTKMPGCLSYIVAKDVTDENAIWITEVWDSEASHKASLSLPSLQAAVAKGKPLIAGFGERFVTIPVGGVGLASGDDRDLNNRTARNEEP